ncbi:hypothetical protein RDABS01_014568 [Bienertia sinuspersici]
MIDTVYQNQNFQFLTLLPLLCYFIRIPIGILTSHCNLSLCKDENGDDLNLLSGSSVEPQTQIRLPEKSYMPTPKRVEQLEEEENLDNVSITNKPQWTRKIHKLCAIDGNIDDALGLLDFLRLRGYRPDSLNLSSIIHALYRLINVNPEFVPSLMSYNRLIDQFCKSSEPQVAHRVLFDMISRGHCPSVVTYTTLISGYCKCGDMGLVFKMFGEMSKKGVPPNLLTYSVLLSGVLRSANAQYGKELMVQLWGQMRNDDDPSVNYMPQGRSVPEEFTYAQTIDSLCKADRHHGASRIVYMMRKRGFTPSMAAYNSIIHGLSKDGGCMRAFQLFEEGIVFGYVPSEYTYKILVESLCQDGDTMKAKEILHFVLKLKKMDQTRIYNIYIRALCLTTNATELLNTLVSRLQAQCKPDVVTLNTVINGLCKMGRIQNAMEVFSDMMMGKFCALDVVTYTAVMGGLLNAGKIKEALVLLHEKMPERHLKPNVVTYNAFIRGLFMLEKPNEAMEIL